MEKNIEAFNGDYYLAEKVIQVVNKYCISNIIETGTQFGKTTEFFCKLVANVYSVELNENNFNKAKERLQGYKNVKLYNESSEKCLDSLISNNILVGNTIFYLDAHDNYPPDRGTVILDELRQILRLDKALVFIHDFKVPRKTFGFGSHAPGVALDINVISPILNTSGKEIQYKYPEKTAGKNRGSVLIKIGDWKNGFNS